MRRRRAGHGDDRRAAVLTSYDEHADWYAAYLAGAAAQHTRRTTVTAARLLGNGPGRCVDVGCGTGVRAGAVGEQGWRLVGVDLSLGQLRHARSHLPVVAGDGAALPFRSASADAVLATLIHTDVPDWAGVVAEVGRILRRGGSFVYVGVHPCFVGPFAERSAELVVVHPGYRSGAPTFGGPGMGTGIRPRVGVRHRTVADLLNPLPAAGLVLEVVEEAGDDAGPSDTPDLLGFRARRAGR